MLRSRARSLVCVVAVLWCAAEAPSAQVPADQSRVTQSTASEAPQSLAELEMARVTMAFDIASVREDKSSVPANSRFPLGPGDAYAPGGLFSSTNQPLIVYLRFAYKLPQSDLLGLPAWVYDDRFDIEARARGKPFEPSRIIDTDTLTVAEFIDKHYVPRYYQAETVAEIASPDGRSKVKLLRQDLGDLRLKQLESEVVVDDYKKRLMATGNVTGANRKLSKLRQMLNWARDWKFISNVPFSRNLVSLDMQLEIARERRLEPGEEEALLAAAEPQMKLRIVAAIDTGMRKGEMLRVQLKRIDFDNGVISLPRRVLVKDVYRQNTKNDKTRKIPITPRLTELLKQRRFIGAEGYVFGDDKGGLVEDIKKAWWSVNLVAHGCEVEWTPSADLTRKCYEMHYPENQSTLA